MNCNDVYCEFVYTSILLLGIMLLLLPFHLNRTLIIQSQLRDSRPLLHLLS
jgi:hypothetical protein